MTRVGAATNTSALALLALEGSRCYLHCCYPERATQKRERLTPIMRMMMMMMMIIQDGAITLKVAVDEDVDAAVDMHLSCSLARSLVESRES